MIQLKQIKAVISDVDGVMTDGGLYFDNQGNELKKFNVKDGQICSMLKKHVVLGIITGRDSSIVQNRFTHLGFDLILQGVANKRLALEQVLDKYKVQKHEVAYIGDDINDLPVMEVVGFTACPADAVRAVKQQVDLVLAAKGGEGAFRELGDLLLEAFEGNE